jgi:gamma-butyrobetaine dioxygenase
MNSIPDVPALRGFAAIWLRSNCGCRACQDPASGQRLASITDVPADTSIRSARLAGDTVRVVFGPDGHESHFFAAWLAAQRPPAQDGRSEGAKRLWVAADFSDGPPQESWPHYQAAGTARRECLEHLLRDGFFLLHDVPREPGTVLVVAGTIGYVRETNYGRLFDVRVAATPANLANTGLAIAPHTDNPYRDPVPTVQLLHCLHTAVAGGDSGLVDGFQAAALLRAAVPAAFEVLASTPVTFRYADATAELVATRPMIGLDPLGQIREIRFNNRSLQPARPGGGASEQAASFYAAYRVFAEMISRPELMLIFRLGPGDCLVFDNTRILPPRTAFAATGRRHLQGCYADLDGVASTLALLRR